MKNSYVQSIRFLFIGRLLYDKGIMEFSDAARQIKLSYPNVIFEIVGAIDNNNPSAISQDIVMNWEKELLIKYHGKAEDIRPFLEKADVLVLPSYREGLPRVILEGMSMAKPIIVTDVPGCRETVVDGENGYLVPVKNSNALADAMVKMIENGQDQRKEMGQKGRELAVDKFDEKIIIQKYTELISSLIIEKEVVTDLLFG